MLAGLVDLAQLLKQHRQVVVGGRMLEPTFHRPGEFFDCLFFVAAGLQVDGLGQVAINRRGGFEFSSLATRDSGHSEPLILTVVLWLLEENPGQDRQCFALGRRLGILQLIVGLDGLLGIRSEVFLHLRHPQRGGSAARLGWGGQLLTLVEQPQEASGFWIAGQDR